MLDLTEMKQNQGIYTYSYRVTNCNTATAKVNNQDINANSVSASSNKANTKAVGSDTNSSEESSFRACFNNAASTMQKSSKSDYSQAEWDAQRKKNTSISKLQRIDGDVAALERVAPNASEEVKSAWLDAAKETGYNGMGYVSGGAGSGATRLYAEMNTSAKMTDNSIAGVQDILGGTVDSAIDAISSARYDRNNMPTDNGNRTNIEKETAFYDSFLDKLHGLKDGTYLPSEKSTFDRMNKNNMEMLPSETGINAEELQVPENYYGSAFFHSTETTSEDGKTYELKARYPENYDATNPSVEVYVTGNGEEKLYKINVNDVNPETASQTELYGLFAYVEDDRNVPRKIDPESSDIYYSALDRKFEKMKEDEYSGSKATEMVNTFRTMDNLSYWDRKELLSDSLTRG